MNFETRFLRLSKLTISSVLFETLHSNSTVCAWFNSQQLFLFPDMKWQQNYDECMSFHSQQNLIVFISRHDMRAKLQRIHVIPCLALHICFHPRASNKNFHSLSKSRIWVIPCLALLNCFTFQAWNESKIVKNARHFMPSKPEMF